MLPSFKISLFHNRYNQMIRIIPLLIFTLLCGRMSAQNNDNEPKDINCPLFPSYFTSGIYFGGENTFFKLNKQNTFVRRPQGDYGPGDTFSLMKYLEELKPQIVRITYPIDSQYKYALKLCDSMKGHTFYRELQDNELNIELYSFSYVNNEIILSYGYLLPWIVENKRVQTRRVIVLIKCTPDLKPIEYYCNGWLQGEMPASLAYEPKTKSYITHSSCSHKDKSGAIYWFSDLSLTKNNWTLSPNKNTMVSPSLMDLNYIKCQYIEHIRDIKIGKQIYYWLQSSPVLFKPGDIIPIFSQTAEAKYLPSRFLQGIESAPNGHFKVVFSCQFNDKRKIGYTQINDKLEVIYEVIYDRDFDEFLGRHTYSKNGKTILILSKSDHNGEHLYEYQVD
jgi:hypothetical protein